VVQRDRVAAVAIPPRRPGSCVIQRRDSLKALLALLIPGPAMAQGPSVSTLIGTGSRGYADQQVNNPYRLAIGPDRALYFFDLDNQRIRRLDLRTRGTDA